MRIPPEGTKLTTALHSTAYVENAQSWARTLEDREAARAGVRLHDAREAVARRVIVPTGTLENLRKGRLKAIAVHVYDRLRSGLIRELEAEVRHLEHELQILRATGADPRENEIAAVVASLQHARQALGLR
jgi:hypothetical protein